MPPRSPLSTLFTPNYGIRYALCRKRCGCRNNKPVTQVDHKLYRGAQLPPGLPQGRYHKRSGRAAGNFIIALRSYLLRNTELYILPAKEMGRRMAQVQFIYVTGFPQKIFSNPQIVGSWSAAGQYSDQWTTTAMTEAVGDDGCPRFTVNVELDNAGIGHTFGWGVMLDGPNSRFLSIDPGMSDPTCGP
jgi:hypothetical protein